MNLKERVAALEAREKILFALLRAAADRAYYSTLEGSSAEAAAAYARRSLDEISDAYPEILE